MTTPRKLATITVVRHSRRRGFTLAELMVSMTIMTVLMGAMTSAILIASRALPDPTMPAERKAQVSDVVDQIAGELYYATSITEETQNAVTFAVADRSHGVAGPETIRYAWSATVGDPLTRQYNGGTVVNVCEDVQLFELVVSKRARPLQGTPSVLLIVQNAGSLNAQDAAKKALIESWGFPVQVVDDGSTQSALAAATDSSDVIYVSGQVSIDVSPFIKNSPKGIVCEEGTVSVGLGVGKRETWISDSRINILNNAHEITAPFATGVLTILDSSQNLLAIRDGLAPGADLLADSPKNNDAALVAIEVDGGLYGGGQAAARRVSMPWGRDSGFDCQLVNADGKTLMRRSIVWAAAPVGIASVRITLQLGSDPSGRAETQVQLLNLPGAL